MQPRRRLLPHRPTVRSSGRGVTFWLRGEAFPPRRLARALVRQAKLDVSCRVKVPVGQGLATHPYRVLRGWRSGIRGESCGTGEQEPRSVDRAFTRPEG